MRSLNVRPVRRSLIAVVTDRVIACDLPSGEADEVHAATVEGVSRSRSGLLAAVGGYLLWGLFPLYWPLLEPAAPVEILAHRIVWSLAFLIAVLALTSGFGWVRELSRRTAGLLAVAAALVSVNWG